MFQKLIDRCESGDLLASEEAIQILDERLSGKMLDRVFCEANRRMRIYGGNRGRIWSAIGVDSAPCCKNCRFCSHGAKWGVFDNPHVLSVSDVLKLVDLLLPHRPDWITLRTTQDYGIDRLCYLVKRLRGKVSFETEIVVNTGEFDIRDAEALKKAGVATVYHTIRLREGVDTGLSVEERIETLKAMQQVGLKMAALVEPLGPEHTDEEIVEAAFHLKSYGIRLGGVMGRVPIPGTPLYELGQVSEERQIRVVALTRLIYGPEVDAICIHPPTSGALRAGANTVVVECGAIPRDQQHSESAWRGFSPDDAQKWFIENGFNGRAE